MLIQPLAKSQKFQCPYNLERWSDQSRHMVRNAWICNRAVAVEAGFIDRRWPKDTFTPRPDMLPPPQETDENVTQTNQDVTATVMAAEAYIARLGDRGIEYVFANAGTDFAPIVEALSRHSGRQSNLPRFMIVPHENVAMAMAHGYYRVAGKPAAVMVHVTVGTANAMCGLMNAARDNIPVLLAAGRTPASETGHIGSRNRTIHWGQESFDQGGMVREYVKWDYELRHGQPVEAVVDRALDIAMSEPRGPVYLTLPREVLTNPSPRARREFNRPLGTMAPAPARSAIEQAAALIERAEFPLIVTSSVGRNPEAIDQLAALADEFAVPVVQSEARDFNLPTNHPMHVGFEPSAFLSQADVVIVLDSAIPWIPRIGGPGRNAKIINISNDPLLTRFPFRETEADLLVAGDPCAALAMLRQELAGMAKSKVAVLEARRKAIAATRSEMQARRQKLIESSKDQTPIHPAWLAHCLNQVKSDDAIVVSELGVPLAGLTMTKPRTFMGSLLSGGLGFGLGAALGAKLAAPQRDVVVAVGDGSYMFGNPLSYHYVGRAENLPTLTIVANNSSWHAVRQSTLDVFPDGTAAKANTMPLTELKPSPDFEKVIETCGGRGEKVEGPAELLPALERSFAAIRSGTPVTLNVKTQARR
jgi:acetolactate synthase-1/2/3 large subunit